jgi:hypothetical protein
MRKGKVPTDMDRICAFLHAGSHRFDRLVEGGRWRVRLVLVNRLGWIHSFPIVILSG